MTPLESSRRLLLIGWDAADWKVIDPLLAKGEMPHLATLIHEGVRGNIGTLYPPLSPMLWTSIATGKRPGKHGIHGFIEPTADGLGIRPVTNLGRKTKAFWNILNQNGKRSIVVGWWPSHPAEPIRGAMVSDHFPLPPAAEPGAPMRSGTVSPERWAGPLADLRVHGTDITGDMLSMFAPGWESVDQERDQSVHDLAKLIAETMSIHCAATELMAHEPWDLAAIYFSGIDHFSHRFMRGHAGKPLRSGDSGIFSGVVANAYRYHDAMLGRLLQLAGHDCPVMLLSDHGFHSDSLLPDYIPAESAGPAVEHREFGIFCLRAPGVLKGARIFGGSVLDIAPTVLHLFGLPAGADMDGKVLINAFAQRDLLPPVPSWDDVPGDDGCHDPSLHYDSADSVESLKQLVELGYIEPPSDDVRRNVDDCVTENRFNLARSHMDAGRADVAAALLRELLEGHPDQARFHQHLIHALLQQGERASAAAALDAFDRAAATFTPRAAEELRLQAENQPPVGPAGDAATADRDRARREHQRLRGVAEQATGYVQERLMLRVRLALAEPRGPKNERARELLGQMATGAERRHMPALFLAEGFASIGEPERALEWLRRARRRDPEDWRALSLEARIHFAAKRHQQAADRAVDSLSLIYFQPAVHLLLGASLRLLGDLATAERECQVALAQMPGLAAAHTELARIYRSQKRLGDSGLHLAHARALHDTAVRRRADRAAERQTEARLEAECKAAGAPGLELWDGSAPADRSRVVTIVSGLPRSGTSMMMQMLVAAGIPPHTDGAREADEDNRKGYFEHQQAIRLHTDAAWLPEARGKAVKIVAHLLPFLPAGEDYRVIFMRRDLNEVVASQKAMLDRLGRQGGKIGNHALMRAYTGQLVQVRNWLRKAPGVQAITVDYAETLRDAPSAARRLEAFLGAPFDAPAAARSVDRSLRRQDRAGAVPR